MYNAAIIELEKALDLSARIPVLVSALGYAYAITGRSDDAIALLHELDDLSKKHYVGAIWRSVIYAGLHANDEVITQLERACAVRPGYYT